MCLEQVKSSEIQLFTNFFIAHLTTYGISLSGFSFAALPK